MTPAADKPIDPTATLAALDAFLIIEIPMRAAMHSAMLAELNYQNAIARCGMQREQAEENAKMYDLLARIYSRRTQP